VKRRIALAAVAAVLCGCAATQNVEQSRPRLFIRPTVWEGGLSVAQLRARVKESPFKERVHLLRTTMANLALKWLVEGDEKAAGEALGKMRRWSRTKVVDSFDGTALIDLALGYDWLYTWPGFSDEDKHAVETKMADYAAKLRDYLAGSGAHVFHTRMYAWNAGVGMVGLAIHDTHPAGPGLFRFARDYYEKRLAPARQVQGGAPHNAFLYAANVMYFPTLQFLKAAKSAAGIDYFHTADPTMSNWLRETALFMVYGTRPDLRTVRYGDLTTQAPRKHFRFALDILAAEYRNGYDAWLADRISETYKTSGYHAEWIYLFLCFHDPTVKPTPPDDLPTFRLFGSGGTGHVFFRSDWSDTGTVVHFHCGDYFGNHGHFDQGGFTIFKRSPLALKTGFYDFPSDHRLHWYKQVISTNTVIFNDPADTADEGRQRNIHYQEANTVEQYLLRRYMAPFVETGSVLTMDDPDWISSTAKDVHAVTADVTAAWDRTKVKRHLRHLAFVAGTYLVVVDETETTKPTIRARWLLHSQVKPEPEGGVWAVRQGESVLYVQPAIPAKPKVTLIGGPGRECEVNGVNWTYLDAGKYKRYHPVKAGKKRQPVPGLGLWRMEIEYPAPATKRLFVTVLTATDDFRPPLPVRATQDDGELVVHIGTTRVTFHKLGA